MSDERFADPPMYSIPEFCATHKLSRGYLYEMWREGTGPRRVKVGRRTLITGDAAREWRLSQPEPPQRRDDRSPAERDFIKGAIPIPSDSTCASVYALISEGRIVYVGMSATNPLQRIGEHVRDPGKRFDAVRIVQCEDKDEASYLEKVYIQKFNPPLNIIKPAPDSGRNGSERRAT